MLHMLLQVPVATVIALVVVMFQMDTRYVMAAMALWIASIYYA